MAGVDHSVRVRVRVRAADALPSVPRRVARQRSLKRSVSARKIFLKSSIRPGLPAFLRRSSSRRLDVSAQPLEIEAGKHQYELSPRSSSKESRSAAMP